MKIQLSFKRMFLEPGKTFAVPMAAGLRLRVVEGMVWATTTSDPDDHWLAAGDEHTVRSSGLTVVESVQPATVEISAPAPIRVRGRRIQRYEIEIPRMACNIAAIAMTALTIGLLVVFPATIGTAGHETAAPVRSITAAAPLESKLGAVGLAKAQGGKAVQNPRVASPEALAARASAGAGPPTRAR